MRKDVECTFGILKVRIFDFVSFWHGDIITPILNASFYTLYQGRFRCLKVGLLLPQDVCGFVFRTCAILHNQLLDVDGLDKPWEMGVDNVDFQGADGEFDEEDLSVRQFQRVTGVQRNADQFASTDLSQVGGVDLSNIHIAQEVAVPLAEEHLRFRQHLVDHFTYRFSLPKTHEHAIKWPSRNGVVDRVLVSQSQ